MLSRTIASTKVRALALLLHLCLTPQVPHPSGLSAARHPSHRDARPWNHSHTLKADALRACALLQKVRRCLTSPGSCSQGAQVRCDGEGRVAIADWAAADASSKKRPSHACPTFRRCSKVGCRYQYAPRRSAPARGPSIVSPFAAPAPASLVPPIGRRHGTIMKDTRFECSQHKARQRPNAMTCQDMLASFSHKGAWLQAAAMMQKRYGQNISLAWCNVTGIMLHTYQPSRPLPDANSIKQRLDSSRLQNARQLCGDLKWRSDCPIQLACTANARMLDILLLPTATWQSPARAPASTSRSFLSDHTFMESVQIMRALGVQADKGGGVPSDMASPRC